MDALGEVPLHPATRRAPPRLRALATPVGRPRGPAPRRPRLAVLAALLPLLGAGCEEAAEGAAAASPPPHLHVAGGDPARGRDAIRAHGCGSCHVIPGVEGAVAWVGPPLMEWARRGVLAGREPNAPERLVAWLRDPQAIAPGSAMPTQGLTEAEARDIAAYLYTLGAARLPPVPAGMALGPSEGGPRPEARLRPR